MTSLSESKSEIVAEIASLLGVEAPPMSSGSTEPRMIFVLIIDRLGLGIDTRMSKPDLAREIVRASGAGWDPDFESRGSTITKAGLLAVLKAVDFWAGSPLTKNVGAEAPALRPDVAPALVLDGSEGLDPGDESGSGTCPARGPFIANAAFYLDSVVQRFGLSRRGTVDTLRGYVSYALPRRLKIAEFVVVRVVSSARFVDVGLYAEYYTERHKNWRVTELLHQTYGPVLDRYNLQVDTWHGSEPAVKADCIITRLAGGYLDGDPASTARIAAQVLEGWVRMLLDHPLDDVTTAVLERAVEGRVAGTGVEEGAPLVESENRAQATTPLHLRADLSSADGRVEERGFVVYEGARARRRQGVMLPGYAQLRRELIDNGTLAPLNSEQFVLTRDCYFDSPSAAASVLAGGSKNGRKEWRTASGLTLKELQERAQTVTDLDESPDGKASAAAEPTQGRSRNSVNRYDDSVLRDLTDVRDRLDVLRDRIGSLEGTGSATYLILSKAVTGLDTTLKRAERGLSDY